MADGSISIQRTYITIITLNKWYNMNYFFNLIRLTQSHAFPACACRRCCWLIASSCWSRPGSSASPCWLNTQSPCIKTRFSSLTGHANLVIIYLLPLSKGLLATWDVFRNFFTDLVWQNNFQKLNMNEDDVCYLRKGPRNTYEFRKETALFISKYSNLRWV